MARKGKKLSREGKRLGRGEKNTAPVQRKECIGAADGKCKWTACTAYLKRSFNVSADVYRDSR